MTTDAALLEAASVDAPGQFATPAAPPLRILLAEDDVGDAFLIKKALAGDPRVGAVEHACDGVEALELLVQAAILPDLAIIDLHMPRKNGFDLLVNLACEGNYRFPIIVLTSSDASSDAARSKLRGADRVYTKPSTYGELSSLITRVVTDLRAA